MPLKPGVAVHIHNPGTRVAEAGRFLETMVWLA